MPIALERGGARPVFRQIVDYLRRTIEAGRLPAGARLAPIRALASELGVNRETVAAAYRELETLGLTESGVGRGTFVRERPARPPGARALETDDGAERRFVPLLSRLASATASLPRLDYGGCPDAVRLERLVPDPALYPVDGLRRALHAAFRSDGPALLDFGDPRGHEGLRRVLMERLARTGIEVYAPGMLFHADGRRTSSLRLTVGAADPDAVARAIPDGSHSTWSNDASSVRRRSCPSNGSARKKSKSTDRR